MATTTTTTSVAAPPAVPARPVRPVRPVARWIPTIDERGRARMTMRWHVPDLDEALRAVVAEG